MKVKGDCEMEPIKRHWWKECVFYQIYPRSFQDSNGDGFGDIRGIINRIDYLVELGVGAIWLGPVFKSPQDDMGYDISDYRDIYEGFGTLADWEELRDKLHEHDIKLLVDLVVNHTSDEHPWFIEARKSRDNPKHDYYIWRDGKDGKEPNNWSSFFTPSAWEYNEPTGEYYLHLFSKRQPDLNWENPEVRDEIYSMMNWWLERGADGFRTDVINLLCKTKGLPDASGPVDMNGYVFPTEHMSNVPPIHELLEEMAEKTYGDRDVFTVGECCAMPLEEGVKYTSGKKRQIDAVFSFEHIDMDAQPLGKWYYRPWKLPELKEKLAKWQTGIGDGWVGLFWSNQDQPRALSRFGTTDERYRVQCAKMLGTILHNLHGTPFIYQGEEIGMVNVPWTSVDQLRDVEILNFVNDCRNTGASEDFMWQAIWRKARDNARVPMPWDDSKNGGFTTGEPWIMLNPDYKEINVASAMADPDSVYWYYRRLIELRKHNLIMPYGGFKLLWPEDETLFAFEKHLDGEHWLIAGNFSDKEITVTLPAEYKNCGTVISTMKTHGLGDGKLTLGAWEAEVISFEL